MNCLKAITYHKIGLEIGGPSKIGQIIYESADHLDNVVFSASNIWSSFDDNVYRYGQSKNGTVIIEEATDLVQIPDHSYHFVFSAHTFEHIANPLKALYEWLRILKPNGYIILVVPEKTVSFDHKRPYSTFENVLRHYEQDIGEDDLSILPEVLELHDLSRDSEQWTFEQFKDHSLNNYTYRSLHHFVYDPILLQQICDYIGCQLVYTNTEGIDLWFVMQKVV